VDEVPKLYIGGKRAHNIILCRGGGENRFDTLDGVGGVAGGKIYRKQSVSSAATESVKLKPVPPPPELPYADCNLCAVGFIILIILTINKLQTYNTTDNSRQGITVGSTVDINNTSNNL